MYGLESSPLDPVLADEFDWFCLYATYTVRYGSILFLCVVQYRFSNGL